MEAEQTGIYPLRVTPLILAMAKQLILLVKVILLYLEVLTLSLFLVQQVAVEEAAELPVVLTHKSNLMMVAVLVVVQHLHSMAAQSL